MMLSILIVALSIVLVQNAENKENITAQIHNISSVNKKKYEEDSLRSFVWNEHRNKVYKEGMKRGVGVFDDAAEIIYNRRKTPLFNVRLEKPKIVYQAKEKKSWGHVQFPRIFRQDDKKIAVVWSLNDDDITAKAKRGWKYSNDNGESWFFRWKERPIDKGLKLSNGDYLKLTSINYKSTLVTKNIKSIISKDSNNFKFYKAEDINKKFINFNVFRNFKGGGTKKEIANVIYFPGTLKHSSKGVFPNQLWGDVKELPNGRLLTCQYPYFYDNNDEVNQSGVAFFESKDEGESWEQISFIPFYIDQNLDEDNNLLREFMGFTEPTFELLDDKRIVCIMRSAPGYRVAPMYTSISDDLGKTWSDPKPITNNGVLPQLLKLKNGVLVLSYGRPGVQIRFAIPNNNNNKIEWSDPFEMLRYEGLDITV